MTEAPTVTVEQGELKGKVSQTPSGGCYFSFQGVPYAKPPLGSLRFKEPLPAEPWDGIRDATSEANVCAQIYHSNYLGDENCLYLNVASPNLEGSLPVMVYIHGGAYRNLSGNPSMYGPEYLVEKDVVVVSLNYRIGALGFLCLNTPEVPGNAGLKDIVLALNWVKKNIEKFGGDADNVTVFGSSSGGAAVMTLTASKLSTGLINKAIVQSGAINKVTWQHSPLDNAKALATELGCNSNCVNEIYEFLLATPIKDIVEATNKLSPRTDFARGARNFFAPIAEKEFSCVTNVITDDFNDYVTTGRINHIPLMIGTVGIEIAKEPNSDDLRAFIPYEFNAETNSEKAVEIENRLKDFYFKGSSIKVENWKDYFLLVSDAFVNVSVHRYVKNLIAVSNSPVYLYKFDYAGNLNVGNKVLKSMGLEHAVHGDELGYLFNYSESRNDEANSHDVKTRERMVNMWTHFAKTGNPTPDDAHHIHVKWLPVTNDHVYYLSIKEELSLLTNPDDERMKFWDSLYDKYYKIWEQKKSNDDIISQDIKPINNAIIEEVISEVNNTPMQEPEETESDESATNVVSETVDNVIIISEETKEIDVDVAESEVLVEAPLEKKPGSTNLLEFQEERAKTPDFAEASLLDVESTEEVVQEYKDETDFFENGDNTLTGDHVTYHAEKIDIKSEVIRENGKGDVLVQSFTDVKVVKNGSAKNVVRANDPPEDDLPKNIGVNKFVSFFESLGGKK